MSTAIGRSVLRQTIRYNQRTPASKRAFASSAHLDDKYEAEKWEKITYAGIATCTVLAIYNLLKGHRHYEEPPVQYPYMRIRNKDFPWALGS